MLVLNMQEANIDKHAADTNKLNINSNLSNLSNIEKVTKKLEKATIASNLTSYANAAANSSVEKTKSNLSENETNDQDDANLAVNEEFNGIQSLASRLRTNTYSHNTSNKSNSMSNSNSNLNAANIHGNDEENDDRDNEEIVNINSHRERSRDDVEFNSQQFNLLPSDRELQMHGLSLDNVQTLQRTRFDVQNDEVYKSRTRATPPGFGRRRSKSQGHILPGRNLGDFDPYDLVDPSTGGTEGGTGSVSGSTHGLRQNLWANEFNDDNIIGFGRRFANSLHDRDFEDTLSAKLSLREQQRERERELDLSFRFSQGQNENALSAASLSNANSNLFASSISSKTKARLGAGEVVGMGVGSTSSSAAVRDRAESDFGRYYSPKIARPDQLGQANNANGIASIGLNSRSPLGFPNVQGSLVTAGSAGNVSSIGEEYAMSINLANAELNQTMNSISQMNQINQSMLKAQLAQNYANAGGVANGGLYGSSSGNSLDLELDLNKPKRQAAGSNKGDWVCLSCGNTNYSWRHVCNMRKCRAPKPGHLSMEPTPPGSWACLTCGNLNYAERMVCNMRKCRAPRPSPSGVNGAGNGLQGIQSMQQQQQQNFNALNNLGMNQNYASLGVGGYNSFESQLGYAAASPKTQYVMSNGMSTGYSGYSSPSPLPTAVNSLSGMGMGFGGGMAGYGGYGMSSSGYLSSGPQTPVLSRENSFNSASIYGQVDINGYPISN